MAYVYITVGWRDRTGALRGNPERSPVALAVRRILGKTARTEGTLLITGEPGFETEQQLPADIVKFLRAFDLGKRTFGFPSFSVYVAAPTGAV